MLFDSVTWIAAVVCAGPFALFLAVGAMVSILRSDRQPVVKVGWSLAVLALPILGPLAWLVAASRWPATEVFGPDPNPAVRQTTGPSGP